MDLAEPKLKWLTDWLPEGMQPYGTTIALGSICVLAALGILLLLSVIKRFAGRGRTDEKSGSKLEEVLSEYPDLKPSTGDRQLRVEGVPVRLRLVVVAPAGTASGVDVNELASTLDQVVQGLGEIYTHDKPRVRVWPTQASYQGFANYFHRNTVTGAAEGEQTRWVMVAGRVKLGKSQIMLGLAMQSIKPNTVGRRTVDAHEWASILRVRVRD